MKSSKFMQTVLISASAMSILIILMFVSQWPFPTTKAKPPKYPSDHAWLQRTFPYGVADRDAHLKALYTAQQMRASAISKNTFTLVWEFAGPTNVTGRVSDIEFNPVNPNIVYAGAVTGGVFKSTNMGATWFPVFDEAAVLSVGDIGIDPVNPEVIYVGTGEANGGHNNFEGGGMYKSINGGASWQSIGLELTSSIGRILVDPSNPQRIFVAAVGSYFSPNPERGVYRSTNGGSSWERILYI